MTEKLAAISIDLDEVPCYCAIHDLPVPRDERAHAIYDLALPRLLELLESEGIRATLFVVGRDLDRSVVRQRLRAAAQAGHEIGSHSLSHYYDLTRRDDKTISTEIREATLRITEATSVRPTGFRAPGYTITDEVLEILVSDGYRYDSSVFPCPAYFAAKGAAIGLIKLRGRKSRSIVDDPRVLTAPADPYRVGTPYWTPGEGLLELPIGVTADGTGRLPFIGTSVVLSSPAVATMLTHMAAGRSFVNLELHGIDLADADEDGLAFLAPHQPDLRRTAAQKRESLLAAIRALRETGHRFVTLDQAAKLVEPIVRS